MKKHLKNLVAAGIGFALALPFGLSAQTPAIAKKATLPTQSAMKLQPVKETKLAKPLAKVRGSHQVNDMMRRNSLLKNPRLSVLRAPSTASASVDLSVPLMGSLLYSDDHSLGAGVYSIATDASGEISLAFETEDAATYGGVAVDGNYYMTTTIDFWGQQYIFHEVYDIATGDIIDSILGESYTALATDMTYDPVSSTVYGCFFNETGSACNFCTLDLASFTTTPICELLVPWNACACDAEGNLYAIDFSGELYSVDKQTGELTLIGDTGIEPYYTTSAVIDPKSGVMFWTVSPDDEKGYLYTVDTATAEATLVCQFVNNDQLAGLFIPAPAAESGAPAAADDLSVAFADGALTGKLTFTAPKTLFDGSAPADDQLSYRVLANGTLVAQGSTQYGAEVVADITVAEAGEYTIVVIVSNADGDSPNADIKVWVGTDVPDAPENVELVYANGVMTLTWDTVSEGVHEGFVGDVTYTVYRAINNGAIEQVAEGLTDTVYTENVAETSAITVYTYIVVAVAGDGESAPAKSNPVTLGSLSAPYSINFTTATDIDGYTVIDANGDGKSWTLQSGEGVRVTYNTSKEMDDWFITPPIALEAGKAYTFTFVAASKGADYPERVEAAFAAQPTVEALSANIIVDPEIVTPAGDELSAFVVPEADGKYYFGIHGCSDPDQFYLYIKSLSISAGMTGAMAAAPEDLTVVADPDGANSAIVTVTVPDKSLDGEALTAVSKLEISINNEIAAVISNPEPGSTVTLEINVDAPGIYTIGATAVTTEGPGQTAIVKARIGVGIPAAPTNVEAQEIGNTGKVIVSWDAPTTDVDGYPINPALITYTVVNYFDEVLAEGVTGTSVEIVAWEGEGQTFDYFDVTAVTEAGKSKPASSPMIAIGEPYDMPLYESFSNGDFDCGMGAIDNGAEWYVFTPATLANVMGFGPTEDSDDTDGLTMMYGNVLYASGDLFTAKVNITGKNPVLAFDYYVQGDDDENILSVYVKDEDGNIEQLGETLVMNEGDVNTWQHVQYSLEKYQGKYIQVYFRGVVLAYTSIFLDAISIYDLPDYDLGLTDMVAPAEVGPNEEFEINVTVANEGANDIDEYKVQLSLNGEVIAEVEGEPIAAGETASVDFAYTFSPVDAEENIFVATLICAVDEVDINDSIDLPVVLVLPNYPVATDLTAESSSQGVVLTWNAPDMEDLPKVASFEDFEEYDPFATSIENWTLVDVDGKSIGSIQGIDLPVNACAFFVMDNTDESKFNSSFAAHSGNKYMSTMYNTDGSKQSDWMISPELSGEAQTISLYAKSYTSNYGLETLSIYYSTTDADPSSFTRISTEKVPAEWTEYTASLPEGALYFAIVCESQDIFMLFVDDVTYIGADSMTMDLTLEGYNIYRDGVLINDAPVTETTYIDAAASGTSTYVVTAVYAEGESAPSNEAMVTSGIRSALGSNIAVQGRTIVINGAEGKVSVFTTDGKVIYDASAAVRNAVTVAPGIYMVKAGKRIEKVVVR